jgi:hypothetical protein
MDALSLKKTGIARTIPVNNVDTAPQSSVHSLFRWIKRHFFDGVITLVKVVVVVCKTMNTMNSLFSGSE